MTIIPEFYYIGLKFGRKRPELRRGRLNSFSVGLGWSFSYKCWNNIENFTNTGSKFAALSGQFCFLNQELLYQITLRNRFSAARHAQMLSRWLTC